MRHAYAVAFCWVPFVVYAGGCSGGSSGSSCSLDPACYEVSATGECSLDLAASCFGGEWHCSSRGTLGSGCLPDGGIAPPTFDAGACVLDTLHPPLSCTSDVTCAPYGGTCEFPFDGPGECVCGGPPDDAGCTGPGCDVCTLPSFDIFCNGPGDTTTCAPYGAICAGTGPYVCACVAAEGPHNGGDSREPTVRGGLSRPTP
jgi:hypothetical protein